MKGLKDTHIKSIVEASSKIESVFLEALGDTIIVPGPPDDTLFHCSVSISDCELKQIPPLGDISNYIYPLVTELGEAIAECGKVRTRALKLPVVCCLFSHVFETLVPFRLLVAYDAVFEGVMFDVTASASKVV
jgi:hypothetical protein